MAQKGSTAEQQLLSLIEEQEKAGKGVEKKNLQIVKRNASVLSANVLRSRIAFFKEKFKIALKGGDTEFALDLANVFLIVLIAGVFGLLAVQISRGSKQLNTIPDLIASGARKVEKVQGIREPQAGTDYLGAVGRRDIFKPLPKEAKAAAVQSAFSAIKEIAGKLRLVGISPATDEKENYAMIEDTSTQNTFFLKEGESVLGLKIVKITPDKVVLSDGKETTELR